MRDTTHRESTTTGASPAHSARIVPDDDREFGTSNSLHWRSSTCMSRLWCESQAATAEDGFHARRGGGLPCSGKLTFFPGGLRGHVRTRYPQNDSDCAAVVLHRMGHHCAVAASCTIAGRIATPATCEHRETWRACGPGAAGGLRLHVARSEVHAWAPAFLALEVAVRGLRCMRGDMESLASCNPKVENSTHQGWSGSRGRRGADVDAGSAWD